MKTSNKSPGRGRKSGDTEPRPASSHEIAVLASLLAINGNLVNPKGRTRPGDCVDAAYTLLAEIDRDYPTRVIAEVINRDTRRRNQANVDAAYYRPFSFGEVLQVQLNAPAPQNVPKSNRIVSGKPFGKVFYHEKDLAKRPVGTTMVGSIGTEKGLRKAIKRLFNAEDAERVIRQRRLSIFEINCILEDQIKRNHGRIPTVRATKGNPT